MAPGNNDFAALGSIFEFAANQTGGPPNGVFQYNGGPIGIRDITDGTSNTMAFGEWRLGTGNLSKVTRNTPTMTMNIGNLASVQSWLASCVQSATTKRAQHTVFLGIDWAFGIPGFSMGNVLLAPNPRYPNCSSNGVNSLDFPGMWTLSRFHSGGANVLMSNVSVKFLKDSTALQTVWALGSRAQGEVLSADSYLTDRTGSGLPLLTSRSSSSIRKREA